MVDMKNVIEFNYTEALPGGAWLKDSVGNVDWCSREIIEKELSSNWYMRQRSKQGWMTGCWVKVEKSS